MHTEEMNSPVESEMQANRIEQADMERANVRSMLIQHFGIQSSFVRVPILSLVAGLARQSIYASMRSGRFFILHRMLNSSPAVKLDDLVAWYCSKQIEAPRVAVTSKEEAVPLVCLGESDKTDDVRRDDCDRNKERSGRLVNDVLASLRKSQRL